MEVPIRAEGTAAVCGAPNWQIHAEDLRCPSCQYNLRGLAEPRCPECGCRFDWQTLLDAQSRQHPYLFEQHPESNFKSFWMTAWGGLRPIRFWKSMSLIQPTRPGRLVLYWAAAMAVSMLSLVAEYCCWIATIVVARSGGGGGGGGYSASLPIWDRVLLVFRSNRRPWYVQAWRIAGFDSMLQILLVVTVANLLWPWITYAALRFLVSGRRLGRVRRSQVLQCILYSFDASIWGAALFVVIALVATIPSTQGIYLFEARDHLWPWVLGLVLACYLLAVYRIMVGCKVYLQFRWPVLTVLGSQIIAFVVASFVPVFAYFVLG